jgi:hypothetical protein
MDVPGAHLAEQVIAPARFLGRLASHGLVPTIEVETMDPLRGAAREEPPERASSAPSLDPKPCEPYPCASGF